MGPPRAAGAWRNRAAPSCISGSSRRGACEPDRDRPIGHRTSLVMRQAARVEWAAYTGKARAKREAWHRRALAKAARASGLVAGRGTPRRTAVAEISPPRFALPMAGLIALAAAVGIGRFLYTPVLPSWWMVGLSQSQAGVSRPPTMPAISRGHFRVFPIAVGARRNWVLGAARRGRNDRRHGDVTSVTASCCCALPAALPAPSCSCLQRASCSTGRARVGRNRPQRCISPASARHRDFGSPRTGLAAARRGLARAVAWRRRLSCLGLAASPCRPPERRRRKPWRRLRARHECGARPARRGLGLYGFGYVITATFLVGLVRLTPDMRAIEPRRVAPSSVSRRRPPSFPGMGSAGGSASSAPLPRLPGGGGGRGGERVVARLGGAILAAVCWAARSSPSRRSASPGRESHGGRSAPHHRAHHCLVRTGPDRRPGLAGCLHDSDGSFLAPTLAGGRGASCCRGG